MSSSLPQPAAVNAGAVAEDPDNQTLPAAVNAGTVAEDPDNQTLPAATASEKPAQVVSEISEHASVEGSPDQLELGTDGASGSQKVGGTGTTANARPLDRWNQTATHAFRFVSTLFCFVVMGINDACFGALLPYIEEYYDLSYTVISLVFLIPFLGYLSAAVLNNLVHHHFGQRGVAILGPLCRLLGYIPVSLHPPFAVLPIVLLLPGFGGGLEDSGWNAWVGNMRNANELLGILHGAYGLGATIGPLIATAMVTKARLPWYAFFYLMTGLAAVDLAVLSTAFWAADGKAYRASHAALNTGGNGTEDAVKKRTTTRRVLREPLTWLLSVFLFGYVGGEVSLGGWIVTFMLRVRGAANFDAGMAVVGFWLGLTMGRVVLGFVTGRVGEKLAIAIYLLLSCACQLLYWLVPNFVVSAVAVALLGFFLGPCFPAAIVAATKLLPSDFHVSAIGVAAAMGGAGGALFPFIVGAIAQHRGVEVLQPVVLAIWVTVLLIWFTVPGGLRRGGLERARENNERVGYQVKRAWLWTRRRLAHRAEATL